jgi:hypothetical protein
MMDAGMPMPALVFWMPMPTYANRLDLDPDPHKCGSETLEVRHFCQNKFGVSAIFRNAGIA